MVGDCEKNRAALGMDAMRSYRARSGLTLVEVIVGLFVIVILLGLLFPGLRTPERKSPAMNYMTQLVTATKAFYTDYGVYPIDPTLSVKTDTEYGPPGWTHHNYEVVNVLRADGTDPGPNYQNAINPRRTVYLDVPNIKDSANPRYGLGTGKETNCYGITTPGEWYDPWGSPYMLFIDANGDGVCDLRGVYSDFTSSGAKPTNPHTGVAAASLGPDRQIGMKGDRKYAGSDDEITGIGLPGKL
jgi:type II secretory pathway pseudopilin PulG